MKIKLDMFGALMENKIISNKDRCLIIVIHLHRSKNRKTNNILKEKANL